MIREGDVPGGSGGGIAVYPACVVGVSYENRRKEPERVEELGPVPGSSAGAGEECAGAPALLAKAAERAQCLFLERIDALSAETA